MDNRRKHGALILYFILYVVFVSFILVTASVSFFKDNIDENIIGNLVGKTKGVELLLNNGKSFAEEYYDIKVGIKEKVLQDKISEVFAIMNYGSNKFNGEEKLDWLVETVKNKDMESDKFIWITGRTGNFLGSVKYTEDYQIVNVSEKLISTFNDKKYIDDIISSRKNMFWIEMYNPIHEKYTKNLVIAYYDRNYDIMVYVAALSENFSRIRSDIEANVRQNMIKELTFLSDNGIVGYYDNDTFKAEYYGSGFLENIYDDTDIQEDQTILQMIKLNKNSSFKYVVHKDETYISRIMYVKYDENKDIYYFAGKDINKKYFLIDRLQDIANMITIFVVLICSLIGFKTWEWMSEHYFKKQRRIKKHINLDDK